jgi:hypothetical protein
MGGNSPMALKNFKALVNSFNCSIVKTTKEWQVVDNTDGQWVCGFATISGRQVKRPYVDEFIQRIKVKRSKNL